MNIGLFLIIALLALSFLGMPIAFAMGIGTLGALILGGFPLMVIPQKMFAGINTFALLAIPFFMLAGNLMSGGINKKILDVSNALFGWVKGSLAIVTTVASAIFAAISGSGVATVSAIGGITIPAMKKEGYPASFSAAVSATASILGPLIPPSIFLIVYGNVTATSIAKLFLGAVIPGVGLTLIIALYVYFVARKEDYPSHSFEGFGNIWKKTKSGIWALFMPLLILGGIFSGVFTPTEAAAVSAVYALIISLFIYKEIKFSDLINVFSESALVASTIMILIATSKVSSWVIVVSDLPSQLINQFYSVTTNPILILLFVVVLLLIIGTVVEANAAIVMITPLLLPLIQKIGMSTIQFGVVMALSLCIGLLTPPVGVCLLLGNSIANEDLMKTLKSVFPLLIIAVVFLVLVTFVPGMTNWLPNLL